MEWIQALTIITSLIVFISIVSNLLNKRIDDLRQDINRRFEDTDKRLDRMEQDFREIRQILYKIFEIPRKESD
jgi:alpha-galactosidase